MRIDCTAEIRESTTNPDWYSVRLIVNGRIYFDSPLLRLKIAERAIDELRKAECGMQENQNAVTQI